MPFHDFFPTSDESSLLIYLRFHFSSSDWRWNQMNRFKLHDTDQEPIKTSFTINHDQKFLLFLEKIIPFRVDTPKITPNGIWLQFIAKSWYPSAWRASKRFQNDAGETKMANQIERSVILKTNLSKLHQNGQIEIYRWHKTSCWFRESHFGL